MDQDMCVPCADGYINLRAGAIIMKDGRFLMVGNDTSDYLYSVGGRIKFGETAEEAVVREVLEETGTHMEIDRLGFIHENYFPGDSGSKKGRMIYELSFFFYMKTPDDWNFACESFTEDNSKEHLLWVTPETEKKIYPEFFRTELKNPSEQVKYMITDDRRQKRKETDDLPETFSDGIWIREARLSDAKDIAVLCREGMGYECSETLVRQNLKNLRPERESVITAVFEGKVVGFIHVEQYAVLYFEPMANILGLAVSQKMQHRGIGRRLLKAAEAWAMAREIRTMRLNSGAGRIGAHRFYQAMGYEQSKEQYRFLKTLLREKAAADESTDL